MIKDVFEGVFVADAESGAEALEYLKSDRDFDLIFVDINMPVMNGWDFLRSVSKQKDLKELKVVVLSSSDLEEDILKAEGLDNVVDFKTKPLDFEYLKHLHRLLE
jgi:CheY-like chemotaxis protein